MCTRFDANIVARCIVKTPVEGVKTLASASSKSAEGYLPEVGSGAQPVDRCSPMMAGVSDSRLGALMTYCYLVKRGKPAASLAVPERELDAVVSCIKETQGLSCYYQQYYPGWYHVWVYRWPHVLSVIQALPEAPQSEFEHWVFGKLFGYSEDAIAEFLTSHHLDETGTVAPGAGR